MNTPAPSGSAEDVREPEAPDIASLQGAPLTPSGLMKLFGDDLKGIRQVLLEGQTCRLHIFDATTLSSTVVAEFDGRRFEAPNWSVDGQVLYLNGDGDLWAIALEAPHEAHRVPYEGVPALNNDHVLDPAGDAIYLSAMDGHIYRGALDGSSIDRITDEHDIWHFLHGISPDGGTLGFVRVSGEPGPSRLALVDSAGGPVTVVDTGDGHIDGPEWSPDGEWIYFNTERWATQPGHAQLARVPSGNLAADAVERLISTDTVDWFPHLSPDGRLAVYLQYPAGTVGHPENKEVELVVVETADWSAPLARIPLFGGQGTINVNSWSPDSTRFAYISFPIQTSD
ncbi:TolB protein [Leifsonia sp. EB41]|uniref:TolB family protein n=1 Tax=Leifsonia sp. EB41 TaxID=3156260 RepID=UPI003516FB31